MIEALVTQRSNPMIYLINLASMSQGKNELIKQYLVYLRTTALGCNISYLCSEYDLSDMYIKDQLIRGIVNDALQTGLLAKARVLKSLDKNMSS